MWENGNYYLIAYTEGMLRHYRVDKMQRAEALPDAHREGADAFASFDVNTLHPSSCSICSTAR